MSVMAATWYSITVEVVSGHGQTFWPRPGRMIAASRAHTFQQLAESIDTAFARWDPAHLHSFKFADDTLIGPIDRGWDDTEEGTLASSKTKLSRLKLGEQFVYEFDFGDEWLHICTVAPKKVDPWFDFGYAPTQPLVYSGWGTIPDQYGRRWNGDDGWDEDEDEKPVHENPHRTDLPPLMPWWGPGADRYPD